MVAALCSALVLFARSLDAFLYPIAGWEDATQGLNYYTSAGASPLHYYAGYISFVPNLVDWLSVTLLPLYDVPFAQAYFALVAAACIAPALSSFFQNILRWKSFHATAVAIVLTCLPWGDVAAVSNKEFSIWSLLSILFITAFNPLAPSTAGKVLFVAWRLCIIASTPLSAICLPIWCLLGWKGRGQRGQVIPYSCLAGATLAYLQIGLDHAHPAQLVTHSILSGLGAGLRLATEKSLVTLIIRDIVRVNFGTISVVPAALILVAAVFMIWKLLPRRLAEGWRHRNACLVLVAFILTVSLACGVGRGSTHGAVFVLTSPRYHYIPQLLWLTIAAIILHASAASSPRARNVMVFLAAVSTTLIAQKGWKSYQSANRNVSREISAFLEVGEAKRELGPRPQLRYMRIRPDSDWSIVLFAPAVQPSIH